MNPLRSTLALLLCCAAAAPGYAQVTATWTGAGADALYSNPDNWDLGGDVPVNGGTTYGVVIPGGGSVWFDLAGPSEIDALDLGSSAVFAIDAGRSLTVLGEAMLAGEVAASDPGTSLGADGPGSSLADGARLLVDGGANVVSSAPSYGYSGSQPSTAVVFSALGAGSLLDLSSLESYVDDRNLGGAGVRTLRAGDGGVLDLSGLVTLEGGSFDDLISIDVLTGGQILLDQLATTSSRHRFLLEAGTALSLPALTSVDQLELEMGAAASLDAPNLTQYTSSDIALDPSVALTTGSLTNVDGSRLAISGGLNYADVVATAYDYTGNQLPNNATIFSADGAGSLLDLSSLQVLEDDRNLGGAATRTVSATNGGTVDLSNVETVIGSAFDDELRFEFTPDGTIDLGNVVTMTGKTRISLEPGVDLDLLQLTAVDEWFWDLPVGSSLDAPNLTQYTSSDITLDPSVPLTTGSLTNVDGSRIAISGGLSYANVIATAYDYTGSQLDGNATLFSADGAGSLLDLSSLQLLEDDRNFGGAATRTVSATNGGTVDLSGVTDVIGAAFDDELRLAFTPDGTIDLDNVVTMTGKTRVSLEPGVDLDFLQLIAVDEWLWDLPVGSSLDAPNLTEYNSSDIPLDPSVALTTGPLTNVDGSRIAISGGLSYTDVVATAYDYTGNQLPNNASIFSADGAGSVLDLSSLQLLEDDRNFGGAATRTISATNGGTVDLSGVTDVIGAAFDDELRLAFTPDGTIDLDNVVTMTGKTRVSIEPGVDLDFLQLIAVDEWLWDLPVGSSLDAPNLTQYTSSNIPLDPSVALTTGPLANVNGSRIAISGGLNYAGVIATAYDYTGSQLDGNATVFSADGAGSVLDLSSLQLLEDDRNFGGAATRTVSATNGGTVDLSNVETVIGATFDDQLRFRAETGGRLDLSQLGGITRSGGISETVAFEIEGAGSTIEVGNLHLIEGDHALSALDGGSLQVREGFVFTNTSEADVMMDGGRVVFRNATYPGRNVLEVGGEDLGIGGPATGNFGIGQLVVGNPSATVTLQLVDWEDNGNGAGGTECLYLFGLDGEDGLRVLGGSTLLLSPEIEVYANLSGVVTRLLDLFPEGEVVVPFDEGFLGIGDTVSGTDEPSDTPTVASIDLSVSPNPFRSGDSQIRYGLANPGRVRLQLFDVRGRRIRTLVDADTQTAGLHGVVWDGRDENGATAPSGVYFIRLDTEAGRDVHRIVVVD